MTKLLLILCLATMVSCGRKAEEETPSVDANAVTAAKKKTEDKEEKNKDELKTVETETKKEEGNPEDALTDPAVEDSAPAPKIIVQEVPSVVPTQKPELELQITKAPKVVHREDPEPDQVDVDKAGGNRIVEKSAITAEPNLKGGEGKDGKGCEGKDLKSDKKNDCSNEEPTKQSEMIDQIELMSEKLVAADCYHYYKSKASEEAQALQVATANSTGDVIECLVSESEGIDRDCSEEELLELPTATEMLANLTHAIEIGDLSAESAEVVEKEESLEMIFVKEGSKVTYGAVIIDVEACNMEEEPEVEAEAQGEAGPTDQGK